MNRRMLIVEDEETIRWALQEIFMRDGWEVHGAADADEAERSLQGCDYDFVITDLKMPGQGGIDVIRQARRRNPRAGVVVLTGYESVETAVGALRLGVWDYVTKPCDMAHLRRRIEEFLEQAPPPPPAEAAPEALSSEDIAGFLNGAGTPVLNVSLLESGEGVRLLLEGLRGVMADIGVGSERAEQILQVCVDAVAALANGADATGRAGLLKGRLMVALSCGGAPRLRARKALEEAAGCYGVDVQIIESEGACSVVLSEELTA